MVSFEARALRILGLSAPIASCAGCGRRWSGSDRPVFYAASAGGILCAACRGREPLQHGVMVPGSAVRLLEDLAGRDDAAADPAPPLSAESPDRPPPADLLLADPRLLPHLRKLTGESRVFYLEHDFKMLKYISNFL